MPRILLFGVGGVGAIYSWILSKNTEVTCVCRSNYSAVEQDGFKISSEIFGDVIFKPHVVKSVEDCSGEFDYVVVTSKATVGSKPSVPDLIAPAVGQSTSVLVAQNGIGLEEEYALAFPGRPILSGVVYLPVTQTTPGNISMGALERLELGTYPHDAPPAAKEAAKAFAKLFHDGGATCTLHEDVQENRWSKLLVNASWNPICALSLSTDVEFMRSSHEAAEVAKAVMLEIIPLANAKGYASINKETAEWQMSRAIARMNGVPVEPSMLTDVRYGRQMEVEAIVGNTVRIARRLEIATPMLDLLYALASGLNASIARSNRP